MPFDHWLAFAGDLPRAGSWPALGTVAGVALGDFTAMTASMLGLGALLAASAARRTIRKPAVQRGCQPHRRDL
ncbi:MAG TPA: hypothetical protein VN823_00550 [Stellaceae bacterium]|nr:hypothetical protein [Stellaceae bacterium]